MRIKHFLHISIKEVKYFYPFSGSNKQVNFLNFSFLKSPIAKKNYIFKHLEVKIIASTDYRVINKNVVIYILHFQYLLLKLRLKGYSNYTHHFLIEMLQFLLQSIHLKLYFQYILEQVHISHMKFGV